MPKLSKVMEKETRISQKINLKDVFGKNFSNQTAIKEAFGQALIEKMLERISKGDGVNPESLKKIKLKSPYSDEYAETLEFKAAGKSQGSVTMEQSGDMLRAIDVLDVGSGNVIEIGIAEKEEAAKAHGHQTGKNGKAPAMKRPFFGITKGELRQVAADFRSDINRAFRERGDDRQTLLEAFASRFLAETASGQDED